MKKKKKGKKKIIKGKIRLPLLPPNKRHKTKKDYKRVKKIKIEDQQY